MTRASRAPAQEVAAFVATETSNDQPCARALWVVTGPAKVAMLGGYAPVTGRFRPAGFARTGPLVLATARPRVR
jgi:hypothetical protein